MLQRRLSVIMNNIEANTFGTPAMSVCDADKLALAMTGTDHDIKAWNRSSRQSLNIPIRP